MSEKTSISKKKKAEYNKRYYEKNREKILSNKKHKSKKTCSKHSEMNDESTINKEKINISSKVANKKPSTNELLVDRVSSSKNLGELEENLIEFPVKLLEFSSKEISRKNEGLSMSNIQTSAESGTSLASVWQEWKELFVTLLRPCNLLLLIASTLLTSVMVLQGTSYFREMGEINPVVAALIVELLLVLGAIMLVFSNGGAKKAILAGMVFFMAIYGAGLYSHYSSIATDNRPKIEQLKSEITEIKSEITEVKRQRDLLPANFLTKKSELTETRIMPLEQKLENSKRTLEGFISSSSQQASVISVALFRLLLMLLNAFVVHKFAYSVVTRRKK